MGMIAKHLRMDFLKQPKLYGEQVLKKRKELKLTREQLSAKCGVSAATIANIEKGRNQATYVTRAMIDGVLFPTVTHTVPYGERLRKARKEKGYTLERLAEKIGTCAQTLSLIEHNKRYPTVVTSIKLKEILGEI